MTHKILGQLDERPTRSALFHALRVLSVAAVACAVPVAAQAQAFQVAKETVQVHGFFQQGYMLSRGNNVLTVDSTGGGSSAMTDGGVNMSSQLNTKLRVGAQLYGRNIGQLGNGHVGLDWAFADYRFNKWIGIRAGKVKNALGLYTDTQDMEFLQTFALLPQGVYPLDLRSVTIAHVGGDVYGTLAARRAGSLNYTVYAGSIPDDARGGYRYGIEDRGLRNDDGVKRSGYGFDLRWTAPVNGLQAGYSRLSMTGSGVLLSKQVPFPLQATVDPWTEDRVYADYQKAQWHFSGEWRRAFSTVSIQPTRSITISDARSWYLTGAYRVGKALELGAYYSHYIPDSRTDSSSPTNHVNGPAVTARFDLNRYVAVKVEGHHVDGYGGVGANAQNFYIRNNPGGFTTTTNMFVLRTSVSF